MLNGRLLAPRWALSVIEVKDDLQARLADEGEEAGRNCERPLPPEADVDVAGRKIEPGVCLQIGLNSACELFENDTVIRIRAKNRGVIRLHEH